MSDNEQTTDDTDGHTLRGAAIPPADDDTEGHHLRMGVTGDDNDTEGHHLRMGVTGDDDVEGHARSR